VYEALEPASYKKIALVLAAQHGHEAIVELLIASGEGNP
jgi:hypothetical protein